MPDIEAVLTTCVSSPIAIILGTNERMDDAVHVQPEHELPLIERALPDRAAAPAAPAAPAGVVAEHVHPAVAIERRLREALDGRGIGDVGRDAAGLATFFAKAGDDALEALRIDVGEHDVHALAGELLREGATHPARRSRHDGDAAAELVHGCSLPSGARLVGHASDARSCVPNLEL